MNRVQKPVEEIEELCPECGHNLIIRTGRFGRFVSCSNFPECRYSRSFLTKTGALCPQCGGDLVERKTKQKKRIFYGCSNYPTCNFALWERPVPDLCPNCGGLMVVPKVGQDPVCYNEVIVVQRASEERPQPDGTTPRSPRTSSSSRTPRKKVVDPAMNGASGTNETTPSPAKKKTARATTRKKTTTRASTAKKTTKRSTARQTRSAKSS